MQLFSNSFTSKDESSCDPFYEICGSIGAETFSFKMLQTDGNDQVASTAHSQGWNKFEEPLPQVLAHCVRANPGVFFDVGANTGFYSIIPALLDYRNVVYSFEPFEPIHSILTQNIKLNQLDNRIQSKLIALSDQQGHANLFVPPPTCNLIETSASLDFAFKESHAKILTVKTAKIDDYLDQTDGEIKIIKIDVEGHEKQVIEGAKQTIARFRPILFVEILERADFDYFTSFISAFKYTDLRLYPHIAISSQQVSFAMTAWNHVFVPNEKLAAFVNVLEASGLDYTTD